MKAKRSIVLLASLVAIMFSASATATANANPVWKFNGTELTGKETLVGAAISSKMVFLGITVECKNFLYNSKISNSGGKGEGEITELPLFECSTNSSTCPLAKTPEAVGLPWPGHLTTVEGKDYIVIGEAKVKEVDVNITFGGASCALAGTHVVKGTAGGVIENSAQTTTFNPTTFTATGTSLKAGGSLVEWTGVFTMEAFESHRLQSVEA